MMIAQLVAKKTVLLAAVDGYETRSKNSPVITGMSELKKFATKRKFAHFETVVNILKPICAMIDTLEGDSYPTLSLVQCLCVALKKLADKHLLEENQKHTVSDTVVSLCTILATGIEKRFLYKPLNGLDDEYMPIDYIAAVLDPHTKHLPFLRSDTERQFVYLAVDRILSDGDKLSEPSLDVIPTTDLEKLLKSLDSPEKKPEQRSGVLRMNSRKNLYSLELATYLDETRATFSESTLAWWRGKAVKYPGISELAKIYLAVPASSATVERLFSRASIVLPYPAPSRPYLAGVRSGRSCVLLLIAIKNSFCILINGSI
jgi:hypothetical protein